jgi:hypothetical protein
MEKRSRATLTFQFYPSPIQTKSKEKPIPLSSYTCQEKKNPSTSIFHVSSSSSHVSDQFIKNMGGHDSLQPAENCSQPSWRCPLWRPIILDNSLVTVASSFSSTSETVGFTPRPFSNQCTTWHMHHPPRLPSRPHIHSTIHIYTLPVPGTAVTLQTRPANL